jgi:hypothetical protein
MLLGSEIRHCRNAIEAVSQSTVVTPRIVNGLGESKKRISLGEGFVPVSRIRHSPGLGEPDATQFLIDAILEGPDATRSFLSRSMPNETAAQGAKRVAVVKNLMQADPEGFIIWVAPTDDLQFEVLDGNHRLRLAQIWNLKEMKVTFFVNIPSLDWSRPSSFFLGRLVDSRKSTLRSS